MSHQGTRRTCSQTSYRKRAVETPSHRLLHSPTRMQANKMRTPRKLLARKRPLLPTPTVVQRPTTPLRSKKPRNPIEDSDPGWRNFRSRFYFFLWPRFRPHALRYPLRALPWTCQPLSYGFCRLRSCPINIHHYPRCSLSFRSPAPPELLMSKRRPCMAHMPNFVV